MSENKEKEFVGMIICEIILYGLIFFAGASVYSFLNVVIYRVPRGESFVTGRSYCPSCGHILGALDLIPVISFLFLKGKCRYCKTKIGVRDTLIEIFGGALLLFCMLHFEKTEEGLTVFAFFAILTVVAFLDIDTMEIADGCHLCMIVLSVISFFTMPGTGIGARIAGALCVSLPMLLLALVIPGAFGGGDIKLMAACGLFLGWKLTLVSTFWGFLFGGIWGVFLLATKKAGRKESFPFGPFLCIGMGIGLLYGQSFLDWYFSLI